MDVDRLCYSVSAKDGDQQKRLSYMRQVGSAASAFEHAVPERLFADPGKPPADPGQPQGVSAVKALALAAAQGQKIYTLNQQNQSYHGTLLAQLQIDVDAKGEIQNALNAGKEVTVHQTEITLDGWTGSGYIILDPATGAGAYKISGGENGGWLSDIKTRGLFFAGAIASILETHPWLGLAVDASTAIIGSIWNALSVLIDLLDDCKSMEFLIALVAITFIASLIVEFALIVSGVGFIVSFIIGYLVGKALEMIIDIAAASPLCRRG